MLLNVTYLTKRPGTLINVYIAAHVHQPIITLDILLFVDIQWHVHCII